MDDRVTQKKNKVQGDMAARDIYKTVNVNAAAERRQSTMSSLVAKYKTEVESNRDFREFILALQYYLDPVASDEVKSLADKLSDAGRSKEVKQATRLKEIFVAKLHSHQLSPTAQQIYAHLLGYLYDRFVASVTPKLMQGAPRHEVDAIMVTEVIEPAMAELEANVLLVNSQELRGMIYYLTGGCHLRWCE